MENLTKQELIDFEEEIRKIYEAGKIKAPVHFSKGNEDALIEIFKEIKEEDWVFSNHRSHYHGLLKGISKEWMKKEILEKRSIHLNSNEKKFFTSSIVGGQLPIALGTALALKLKNSNQRVWVFCGDMAAESGAFHECEKYAKRHNLPITFVIEDNELSVDSPTQKVWGEKNSLNSRTIRYKYTRLFPHHGSGQWVSF